MNKNRVIINVTKAWKLLKLRSNPMLDEFAIKLNCEPTFEEIGHIARIVSLLEEEIQIDWGEK